MLQKIILLFHSLGETDKKRNNTISHLLCSSAFEVQANHVQMTYYYLFIILFMVIAFLVDAIRKGELARFGKATAVCVVGALIGISLNLSNLYHTWQYGQETMRGKSELVKKNVANQTSSGLDRDYITQWSYGIDETWTLMIPDAKGGASVPLAQNQQAMEKADPNFVQIYQQLVNLHTWATTCARAVRSGNMPVSPWSTGRAVFSCLKARR